MRILSVLSVTKVPEDEVERERRAKARKIEDGFTVGDPAIMKAASPDGDKVLTANGDDLWLRRAATDERTQVTDDGFEPTRESGEGLVGPTPGTRGVRPPCGWLAAIGGRV